MSLPKRKQLAMIIVILIFLVPGANHGAEMAQNLYPETFAKLKLRVEKHNARYRDVQPGDRYSPTYIPGKGTELSLNGAPLGLIEGADFASALYGMWLGEKPMNKSFKRQLLGAS